MKIRQLLGLALLATAFSQAAQAQTKPSTTVAPGVPINSNNPTTPVIDNGTVVPGQPGTTPPIATPPGTVYSAPSTRRMPAHKRPVKATKTTRP